ncbi:hypothetical protein H2248_003399 [Termitomyces sp. 'cryptogamus']|nr:hypothetical protein H2248_003399 [Termitomyces sp. 'cryptogamus']
MRDSQYYSPSQSSFSTDSSISNASVHDTPEYGFGPRYLSSDSPISSARRLRDALDDDPQTPLLADPDTLASYELNARFHELLAHQPQEAPVHRLPAEVLGLIFLCALEPLFCRRRRPLKHSNCPPMLFCQVCRWWRGVAISMPILWSTFNIRMAGKNIDLALYRLWLKRTQGAPLAINFNQNKDRGFDNVLALIFSHIRQWANVKLNFQPSICTKLLTLQPESLPLLKKKIVSIFAQIPTLSDLCWRVDIPDCFTSVVWSNLRKFSTAATLETGECLALLSSFPQIEDVFFRNYINSPADITSSALTVKNLRSFSIFWSDPAGLFDALTLPSLETLRSLVPADYTSIERLIERSNCTIRHLTVNARRGDLLALLKLKCLHSVCSLRFTGSSVLTDTIARQLTWNCDLSDSSAQLFPNLSLIGISCCHTSKGVLPFMIMSRWHGSRNPHGLKRVEISRYLMNLVDEDRSLLRGLEKLGLDIIVSSV